MLVAVECLRRWGWRAMMVEMGMASDDGGDGDGER